MEYKEIITELQDLVNRSYDSDGYDVVIFDSENKAIEEAIEALYRLIDLES